MISDRTLHTIFRSRVFVVLAGDLIRLAIGIVVLGAIWICLTYYAAVVQFMFTKMHMNDFGKFYYSTRLFLEGQDMYGVSPATGIEVAENEVRQFWNMNPPHFHLLLLPLARLPPIPAFAVWGGLSLVA